MKKFKIINILDILVVIIVSLIVSCVDSFTIAQIITILVPTMTVSLLYGIKRGIFKNEY